MTGLIRTAANFIVIACLVMYGFGLFAEYHSRGRWSKNVTALLAGLGPGVVTGAADLGPSAIITATVVGAAFAHSLLWVVVLCIPFLLTIFSVTARIGVETRKGLLDLVRENYGRKWAMAGAILT